MGPMRAACRFAQGLAEHGVLGRVERVQAELFGSLALTGIGHGTDRAVLLGLAGNEPATIDPAIIAPTVASIRETGSISLARAAIDSIQREPRPAASIVRSCFLPARIRNTPTGCD